MTSDAFLSLGEETYVLLTTFRGSGEAVGTPVWVTRDTDRLLVTTSISSGKVKRLRVNSLVELTPCSMSGEVIPGATTVRAHAGVASDSDTMDVLEVTMLKKYGARYRAIREAKRLRREPSDSIALVVTAIPPKDTMTDR